MQIQFHEMKYELLDTPNVSTARFQATIDKGENTFDSVIADTVDIENITVYDEEEVKGIYTGYNKRIAISIYPDDNISIELENSDIQSQIEALTTSVSNQQAQIDELNDSVIELTPYTETKTAYFNENEKTFYNVPEGNISVFFDNYNGQYSVNRVSDRVIVSFDTLAQATNITISVN